MPNVLKITTTYRCDVPMRKSKERCLTPSLYRWRCTGECKTCFCAIRKDQYGNETHIGVLKNDG